MNIITPEWPAPSNILAFVTTRQDGYSLPPYDSNNLGYHVADDDNAVYKNRLMLSQFVSDSFNVEWINQTHSTRVVIAENDKSRDADAIITRKTNTCLAIQTADCVPILICHKDGREIAAIHAGWRGLLNGIIKNTVERLSDSPEHYLVYIGPCICAKCFEVGNDVLEAFTNQYTLSNDCFKLKSTDKWLANLPKITENLCNDAGLIDIYKSNLCTFEEKELFFSYRRDGKTGRIASIIGLR